MDIENQLFKMVHWTCSCCKKVKPSTTRRRKVGTDHFWTSYVIFKPNGTVNDIICPRCCLQVRKHVDGLTKYGLHTRTFATEHNFTVQELQVVPNQNSQFSNISSQPMTANLTQPFNSQLSDSKLQLRPYIYYIVLINII